MEIIESSNEILFHIIKGETLNVKEKDDRVIITSKEFDKNDYRTELYSEDFKIEFEKNISQEEKWYFGEKIKMFQCIVGNNGTGKTTLLLDLYRYYTNATEYDVVLFQKNQIYVNGEVFSNNITAGMIGRNKEQLEKNTELKRLTVKLTENENNTAWDKQLFDRAVYNPDVKNTLFDIEYDFEKIEILKEKIKSNKFKDIEIESSKIKNEISDNLLVSKQELLIDVFNHMKMKLSASEGELVLLSIYVNLCERIKNLKENNIVLLFDEPNNNFHPEWSRKFVGELLSFLDNLISNKDIHIYMSNHSPLVIADLPFKSVKFLGYDSNGKVNVVAPKSGKVNCIQESPLLGVELNTLFRDNFFLKSTRGSHFTKKFKSLVSNISNFGDEYIDDRSDIKLQIEFLARNLGDEVLKNTLEYMKELNERQF